MHRSGFSRSVARAVYVETLVAEYGPQQLVPQSQVSCPLETCGVRTCRAGLPRSTSESIDEQGPP